MGFTGFLLGFIGLYKSFTDFYQVLLGFTGFYGVLLGFTGFYVVDVVFDGNGKLMEGNGGRFLQQLHLSANPWSCDCAYLDGFRAALLLAGAKIADAGALLCVSNDVAVAQGTLPVLAITSKSVSSRRLFL